MKLEIVPTTRVPRLPLPAALGVALWLAAGAIVCVLNGHLHMKLELCPMKRVTGLPCATCGSTRGVLNVLGGHAVRGFLHNPLVFAALGLVGLDLAGRLIFRKRLRLTLVRHERIVGFALGICLLAVNWLWVYFYVESGRVLSVS